jgi:hypothetical protein
MLYTKPARHSHKNTSMDVLVEIPEHIVEAAPDPRALAEEVVSALNCCRKYKKGMLTIHMDADLKEYVAIKIKGQARVQSLASAEPMDECRRRIRIAWQSLWITTLL